MLERGIIPPNALFEQANPNIDMDFYHTKVRVNGVIRDQPHLTNNKVPTTSMNWPTNGLRRISVNSFGFGGTNGHVVMDDAYHYLEERGMLANHSTTLLQQPSTTGGNTSTFQGVSFLGNASESPPASRSLLVFSAQDEKALDRMTAAYERYIEKLSTYPHNIQSLSYTLACRRSNFRWTTFAVADTDPDKRTGRLVTSRPTRITPSLEAGLAFIFTGQGAAYANMGMELFKYPIFQDTIRNADDFYGSLGCKWKIAGKIYPYHFNIHFIWPDVRRCIT